MTAEPLLATMRFTVEKYEQMIEAGILGPDSRVELLDGEIVPPESSTVLTTCSTNGSSARTS